ncbi:MULTISPECIES: outer membrane protein assembly factor BamB [Variovorax]|jgi:outer membrane protein assembly factor BamB|uniref:outer membrane protein assembly factor BamB n=1 Tax=Variovorax TaxID=34072 RepID=UPI00086CF24C|nr:MULTISPECIES: outer membrane protein assembly factor BamB [Variovorax]MBN8753117.1 outer membrane protein assembly factor BamB [Variovorax sp.]ODU11602.1 MAG: outer membrane protein assembly factor BamB [Variovorax sp. SCN 67-85]ODV15033.1 MAG: outer membrane protein assembly factor BamB [Variovorax sp. SCN 67-20]OJZ05247.1 MAG: outer membrane protein assembly factor BamB [Variovorax sp. 67-131]UKI05320.1 outer membrane protein assembly factor BamB [Variovorax paradoxus]
MNFKRLMPESTALRAGSALVLVAFLAACSGTSKPKPEELPANPALMGVRQAWKVQVPEVKFPLTAAINGDIVTVAGSDGTVVAIDARAGRETWRASAGTPLAAGVGSDGSLAAVVTTGNELVALENGKVLWKQKLSAQAFTAPLVAGRRVFVQTADRSVSAWDGQSGRRLWIQQRAGENLVLRKSGVLIAVGDTLVAGLGGRLVGINPGNGTSRWEAPIAAPRGTNDVERLVDLTGSVSRVGDSVCARAYYASVGCVDTARGTLAWSKPASGADGVSGDDRFVYGTESDGSVIAWRRGDGERAWQMSRLKNRELTSPLAVGRSLIIGESTGTLHFVSREDGALLNRVTPDGSAITVAPVLVGNTVVVVTAKGGVFGYRPE